MFYVYEHLRPDTNAVFYVGKGRGRRSRTAWGRNKHWRNIVDKADGFSVRMVAENVDEELAFLIEVERIDQLRRLGVKLCNMTDGGEGASGCVPSEETRQKISEAGKGRIKSEDTRRKLSEAKKGYTHSEAAKQKMSETRKGRPLSEAAKRKMSETKRGRPKSEEYKQKMRGGKRSEETIRKISGNHGMSVAVLFGGKIFRSVMELAEYTGNGYSCIAKRVRENPAKWGYVSLGRAKEALKED